MMLLRFVTAGNVDDGKSTLIGRLLHDSGAIAEDQLSAVIESSRRRGFESPNLALLTDGLRAEREKGITIDVAYRYFTTAKRRFIIADCPGHLEYTRNMVTGASTANLAVVLVDARKGVVEQTRRHCFVASLLRIPHLVICVNKMDLVDFSERAFQEIREEFTSFSKRLDIHDVTFIPISALHGDNVARRSSRMPWYNGRSLLEQLEEVHIASDANSIDFRFPVQLVLRAPSGGPAAYAGAVLSGAVRRGDEVVALPSGFRSRVREIREGDRVVDEASVPASITLWLEDELEASRGDMLARSNNRPASAQDIGATLCWMDERPLATDKKYIIRQTSAEAVAVVAEVLYKFDINTLSRVSRGGAVGLNDFARVKLRAGKPLHYDAYRANRGTGSFVLLEEKTGATVAAGMILG